MESFESFYERRKAELEEKKKGDGSRASDAQPAEEQKPADVSSDSSAISSSEARKSEVGSQEATVEASAKPKAPPPISKPAEEQPTTKPGKGKPGLFRRHIPLGQILQRKRLITEEQLQEALKVQEERRSGPDHLTIDSYLGNILIDLGYMEEIDLAKLLSVHWQVPFVDLARVQIREDFVSLVPEKVARKYCIFPLDKLGKVLILAMFNPSAEDLNNYISDELGFMIKPAIATRSNIQAFIDKYYVEEKKEVEPEKVPAHAEAPPDIPEAEPNIPDMTPISSPQSAAVPTEVHPPLEKPPPMTDTVRLARKNTEEEPFLLEDNMEAIEMDEAEVLGAVPVSEERFNALSGTSAGQKLDRWTEARMPAEQEAEPIDSMLFNLFAGRRL